MTKKLLSTVVITSVFTLSACGVNPDKSLQVIKTVKPTSTSTVQTINASTNEGDQQHSATSKIDTNTTSDQSSQLQYVYLVIQPKAKLGTDGNMHDAFMNGDFIVKAGKRAKITIYNYDSKSYTFASDKLGLTIDIAASKKSGVPEATGIEFTPQNTGTFQWQCKDAGNQRYDAWSMSHEGFMKGTITVNPASDPYQHISLVVNGDYKWAPDGKLHDAYTPGNFTINKGEPVKLTIYNYDKKFHTFFTTDFIGLNIMVKESTTPGTPYITQKTFTPTQTGIKTWNCFLPCDGDNDDAAMNLNDYMWGHITVK